MKKKWIVANKKISRSLQHDNINSVEMEEIVKVLLENRNLKTKKQIEEFLNPADPYNLNINSLDIKKAELVKAIKRIKKAINLKENIIIYGDYDADGITSTAILWETLYTLGAKVMPFIPHREKHGYGLNRKGINSLLNNETMKQWNNGTINLIITVDNGIVANKAVDYANKKGIDVIITDHHQKKNIEHRTKNKEKYDLPKAHSIIHSTQTSGAGVAWFFAKEIYHRIQRNKDRVKRGHKTLRGFKASNSLELASIGTIADMMPMLGVNRSLVSFGLKELRNSNRLGIKALCSQAGADQKKISNYHIGYIIGPRINAMGRLEDATDSLRLLCTKDNKRADALASRLGIINRQRQQLTSTTFNHAHSLWSKTLGKNDGKKIIFISDSSYNPGVIGLVAGKLAEEFYKPAVVISEEKEYSKGSVRSIKGFNIIEVLRKLKGLFEDIGGHPMAAGFTIKTKKIKELRKELEKLAKKEIKKVLLKPVINVDLEINLNNINWELFNEIEKFSPFGVGNTRPVFVSRGVEVVNVRAVGRERKHLKLKVKSPMINNQSSIIDAIAFGFGNLSKKLFPGKLTDICYSLEKNIWNGNESLQLMVKDIRIG